MPQALFIADLHLAESEPGLLRRFQAFLQQQALQASALYILGDLFNVWLGDDDDSAFANTVRQALKTASDQVPIFFQHGNRDFLLGQQFAEQTGATLLPDEAVIQIGKQRVLIMHGDQLCTDDLAYQQARAYLRNPSTISDFLSKSPQERAMIAAHLRQQSGEAMQQKAADIMDVNAQAVQAAMRQHQVHTLIHGHTHRPALHAMELDGAPAHRLVCGDWHNEGALVLALDEITGDAQLIEV